MCHHRYQYVTTVGGHYVFNGEWFTIFDTCDNCNDLIHSQTGYPFDLNNL